jgi:hypothetical protein
MRLEKRDGRYILDVTEFIEKQKVYTNVEEQFHEYTRAYRDARNLYRSAVIDADEFETRRSVYEVEQGEVIKARQTYSNAIDDVIRALAIVPGGDEVDGT